MVVLYAFLALFAGFATSALLLLIITAALKRSVPSWIGPQVRLSIGYIFANLGSSFLAAAAGGYVAALLAQTNPLIHVLTLAIAMLVLAALSALQQRDRLPAWYLLSMVAITPIGVFAGGLIRLRVLGLV